MTADQPPPGMILSGALKPLPPRELEYDFTAAVPSAASAPCGCPQQDGKIYHQRGTCTDPVVAKLDWYGAPPAAPAPEAATPVEALGAGWEAEAAEALRDLPMSGADSRAAGHANGLLVAAREVRERLAPQWAALAAERDELRALIDAHQPALASQVLAGRTENERLRAALHAIRRAVPLGRHATPAECDAVDQLAFNALEAPGA